MNYIEIIVNGISLKTYATSLEISKIIDILDCHHSDEFQIDNESINIPGLSEASFESFRQDVESSFKD